MLRYLQKRLNDLLQHDHTYTKKYVRQQYDCMTIKIFSTRCDVIYDDICDGTCDSIYDFIDNKKGAV